MRCFRDALAGESGDSRSFWGESGDCRQDRKMRRRLSPLCYGSRSFWGESGDSRSIWRVLGGLSAKWRIFP